MPRVRIQGKDEGQGGAMARGVEVNIDGVCIMLTYLDTWSGFEAAKTAPWPSRGLHHCGKFLEPSDERAGRG